MAQRFKNLVLHPEAQTVGIAHAGCPESAALLEQLIRNIVSPKQVMNVIYEPVTGAHTGPDAIALFFLGAADVRLQ